MLASRSQGGTVCAALLLALAPLLPNRLGAQTLTGRVLEDGRNTPIADASITLVDRKDKQRAGTLSDSLGRFHLAPPEAGEYVIVVERIGYETSRSPLLSIKEKDEGTVSVELMMTPEPVGLEGLEVSVEREARQELRSFGLTPTALGRRWIDRKAVERMVTPGLTKDVIKNQSLAGVWVEEHDQTAGDGRLCVTFRRRERQCAITVLNGQVVSMEQAFLISSQDIESIAILTPNDATTFYGTQGGGGAVLIWTRKGGGGR
ncbi:MAG: carboxypeptidase regulatory-like domain-containing protein [Gemmatimonadota bacterium]|jgi:hypothetical protein